MKRTLSVFLAVVMAFCLFIPAFASAEQTCPAIYIPGIDASAVYADKDDPSSRIKIPGKDETAELVTGKLIPSLISYADHNNADILASEVSEAINGTFGTWFNNSDGTPVGNAGVLPQLPEPDTLSVKSDLRFSYDWRGDPMVIAAELDEYIDYVIENSGCDKVALTCHSLGGCIVLTYVSLYGCDKLSAVIFDTAAFEGVAIATNLLTGKMNFDSEYFADALKTFLGENEYKELIGSTLDIFEEKGTELINSAINRIAPVIYKETLIPVFGTWLTMWSMVDDEKIDEAMSFVFDGVCKDEDMSALRSKIESYNTLVRGKKQETLRALDEKVKVAVISRYGFASLPLVETAGVMSDGVIETKNSSLGATTAPYGDYFDETYLEGKDMKYISPDKTVDASSCLFPEKTWFVKGAQHYMDYLTRNNLYQALLFSDKEVTCDDGVFDRFMAYDEATGSLKADSSAPEKTEKLTFFDKIFNFFKNLYIRLTALFDKLFR